MPALTHKALKYTDKVLTKGDILFLVAQIRNIEPETDEEETYQLNCGDSLDYTFNSATEFENHYAWARKPIKTIQIGWRKGLKSIHLTLSHGDDSISVDLASDNEDWLNEKIQKINEAMDSVRIKKYTFCQGPLPWLALGALSLLLAAIFTWTTLELLPLFEVQAFKQNTQQLTLVFYFMLLGASLYPSAWIMEQLYALNPRIEFDFGTDHLYPYRTKKKLLITGTALAIELAFNIIISKFF
jgi:hypothetical protein